MASMFLLHAASDPEDLTLKCLSRSALDAVRPPFVAESTHSTETPNCTFKRVWHALAIKRIQIR